MFEENTLGKIIGNFNNDCRDIETKICSKFCLLGLLADYKLIPEISQFSINPGHQSVLTMITGQKIPLKLANVRRVGTFRGRVA